MPMEKNIYIYIRSGARIDEGRVYTCDLPLVPYLASCTISDPWFTPDKKVPVCLF